MRHNIYAMGHLITLDYLIIKEAQGLKGSESYSGTDGMTRQGFKLLSKAGRLKEYAVFLYLDALGIALGLSERDNGGKPSLAEEPPDAGRKLYSRLAELGANDCELLNQLLISPSILSFPERLLDELRTIRISRDERQTILRAFELFKPASTLNLQQERRAQLHACLHSMSLGIMHQIHRLERYKSKGIKNPQGHYKDEGFKNPLIAEQDAVLKRMLTVLHLGSFVWEPPHVNETRHADSPLVPLYLKHYKRSYREWVAHDQTPEGIRAIKLNLKRAADFDKAQKVRGEREAKHRRRELKVAIYQKELQARQAAGL